MVWRATARLPWCRQGATKVDNERRLFSEGEEQDEEEAEWIQEHQAGELVCSYYPTYTSRWRPHQPQLVGSVLVIGKPTPQLITIVLGIGQPSATTRDYRTWVSHRT